MLQKCNIKVVIKKSSMFAAHGESKEQRVLTDRVLSFWQVRLSWFIPAIGDLLSQRTADRAFEKKCCIIYNNYLDIVTAKQVIENHFMFSDVP
jgi:hypothetical protein